MADPSQANPAPIDLPDDFFRVRLVCVLLDTCGMCFDKGSQKKKLDVFLTFFQVCYIQSRENFGTGQTCCSLALHLHQRADPYGC